MIPWSHSQTRVSARAVAPVTDSRGEAEIMQALARRLGRTEPWLYEEPLEVVERALAAAVTPDSPPLRSGAPLTLRRKPMARYATTSGKIELAATGPTPLPRQPDLPTPDGRFTLLGGASPRYTNTQFQEIHGPIPPLVSIHPEDAREHDLHDGDELTLTNEQGRLRFHARVSDRVPRGVLWLARGGCDLDGRPTNTLTSAEPQHLGGGPRFNGTRVEGRYRFGMHIRS